MITGQLRTQVAASWLLSLVPVIGALAACGDEAATTQTHVVDSAGISIVTNPAPDSSTLPWLEAAAEPSILLDGHPDPFYQVEGAIRLDDGRIVVADEGSATLRFYDSEGRLLATAGGRGNGPGEFQGLGPPIRYRSDSILTHDGRLGRITLFDDQGRLGRTSTAPDLAYMDPLGALSDGSILARRWAVYRTSRDQTGVDRRDVAFLLLTPDGEVRDTLGAFPGHETFFYRGQRLATLWPIPFGRTLAYDAGGSRVAVGSTDDFRIEIYGLAGESPNRPEPTLEQIVLVQSPAVPIEPEWRDSIRARQERSIRPGASLTRAVLGEIWEALPRHETLPAFRGLQLDQEGRLWVERARTPGDEQPVHDVFDRSGRRLGHVRTPMDLQITDIGDGWILGIRTDELGVERVEAFPLQPPRIQ